MYNSILSQIGHPPGFTAEKLQKMVGFYMLQHPDVFFELLSGLLHESGESFESYCVNVFKGNYWGDNIVLAAIVKMWLISISLVLPEFRMPLEFQHNDQDPDVVIVGNGGDKDLFHPCTHFSQTRRDNMEIRKVGIELVDAVVEKYDDVKQAARDAQTHAAEREKKIVLDRWVSINTKIDRLSEDIEDLTFRKERAKKNAESLELDILDMGIDLQHYRKASKDIPSTEDIPSPKRLKSKGKGRRRGKGKVQVQEEEMYEDVTESEVREEVPEKQNEESVVTIDLEENLEDESLPTVEGEKRKQGRGIEAMKKMKLDSKILAYLEKKKPSNVVSKIILLWG